MTVNTQKLREFAENAKEFASVGVVQFPHTAKAHINGLADTVTTICGEIDAQAAEIARLRQALEQVTNVYAAVRETLAEKYPLDGWSKNTMTIDAAHAALSGEPNGR